MKRPTKPAATPAHDLGPLPRVTVLYRGSAHTTTHGCPSCGSRRVHGTPCCTDTRAQQRRADRARRARNQREVEVER